MHLSGGDSLKISEGVLETITGVATAEVKGVYGLADIKDRKDRNAKSKNAVKIVVSDEVAVIDVAVILKYGVNVAQVSQEIQHNIKRSIQTMIGITVAKVNIHIVDIVPQTVKVHA